ncbi:MAG: grasp-with-spasm system ATP-grasp peptide maturase [Candidatus Azobacteroides sp.]|nr:grasp-with-spasm system ATP-grasp peptide maturase [Candidatus Azobacteroides sp.]
MILLLTCDGDLSCDLVIDWLNYYRHEYIRINSFELFSKNICFSQENGKLRLLLDNQNIPIETIKSIWYRKFGFFEESEFYKNLLTNFNYDIIKHITKEYYKILNLFLLSLKNKKWITNPFHSNLNKFAVLQLAGKCGLNIPNSYISNNFNFIENNKNYIVKSVVDPIIAEYKENKCMMYTTQLTSDDQNSIPDVFFPSLIQEKIEKEYEIRIFYLMGKCYSMAIFSQNDKKTKLDFRQYNWEKPNRYVPYNLSKNDLSKIKLLMNSLKLNCGSIDLIMGIDSKLYFLEINPTGQFGMVDFPCNYGLHKKIAETLIEMDV